MKKIFVIILSMLVMSASIKGRCMLNDEPVVIPIVNTTTGHSPHPKSPMSVPVRCCYYPDLQELSFTFTFHVEEVTADVSNLTTGETYYAIFDSSAGTGTIALSGNSGYWIINISTDSGAMYYGEFTM